MLARQIRLAADYGDRHRAKLFPKRKSRHVGERRAEALHAAPATLRPELMVLMRIGGRNPPTDKELAACCEFVANWAQEEGLSKAALQFAEGAAAIQPSDPYFAFVAGRANRTIGVPWRAEVFYSRAIRHAYRVLNWDVYVRAHLGYGRLQADHGRLRAAANHYSCAARVALDQGIEWLAAQTYHDILLLYFELGDERRTSEYAHKALSTYPLHHERYPIAVHDFVFVCLIAKNHYREALPLLELLAEVSLKMNEKVLVWGSLARVSGNLKAAVRYAAAEQVVLSLAPHHPEYAAAGMLNLAWGAFGLGDVQLAKSYAGRGMVLAKGRGDRQTFRLLKELMDDIEVLKSAPPPAPRLIGEPAAQLAQLAETLKQRLGAWRSHTWTKKESQSGVLTLGPV
jgi:tetratricopeptide (TPR) repeat protein